MHPSRSRRTPKLVNSLGMSPIRRLPPELLSQIFLLCLPDSIAPISIRHAPLLLCQVCRNWRAVAHSTPALWSRIALRLTNRNTETAVHVMNVWIQRAGWCSLTLAFFGEVPLQRLGKVLDTILPVCTRWEHLQLEVSGDVAEDIFRKTLKYGGMPTLRSLELDTFGIVRSFDVDVMRSPVLSQIRVRGNEDVRLLLGSAGRNRLANVQLFLPALMNDCIHYLELCTSIEVFVAHIRSEFIPMQPTRATTILSFLHTLHIASDVDVGLLLDRVTLPALRKLSLGLHSVAGEVRETRWASLVNLLGRSRSPLEELDISIPINAYFTIQCLRQTPHLKTLFLEGLLGQGVLAALARTTGGIVDLVPILEQIGFYDAPSTMDPGLVGAMTAMIVSRWGGPSGYGGRLRSMKLSFWDDYIVQELRRSPLVQRCIAEGLVVVVI